MNGELIEYIQSFGVMGVLILLVIGGIIMELDKRDWDYLYNEWWLRARMWMMFGAPVCILLGFFVYWVMLGIQTGGGFCEYWANPEYKIEKIFSWMFCR